MYSVPQERIRSSQKSGWCQCCCWCTFFHTVEVHLPPVPLFLQREGSFLPKFIGLQQKQLECAQTCPEVFLQRGVESSAPFRDKRDCWPFHCSGLTFSSIRVLCSYPFWWVASFSAPRKGTLFVWVIRFIWNGKKSGISKVVFTRFYSLPCDPVYLVSGFGGTLRMPILRRMLSGMRARLQ